MIRIKPAGGASAGNDRWSIPYAGLMTLLFALFVVLYAQSKTESDKQKKVEQPPATQTMTQPSAGSGQALAQARDAIRGAIQDSLKLESGATDLGEKVQFSEDDRGLVVRLAAQDFFDDGVVDARADLRPLLDRIAKVLAGIPNSIRVEGHTDIEEETQQTEGWSLSAERAGWVVKYWIKRWGMDPARLSAAGLSHFHPLTRRKDDFSRGKNRRVEIVILK